MLPAASALLTLVVDPERNDVDVVLGQAELLERGHGRDVDRAAGRRDAELLAHELLGGVLRPQLVGKDRRQRGDRLDLGTGGGAGQDLGAADRGELGLAGEQRRVALVALEVDELHLEAFVGEVAGVLGDPHRQLVGDLLAVADRDLAEAVLGEVWGRAAASDREAHDDCGHHTDDPGEGGGLHASALFRGT